MDALQKAYQHVKQATSEAPATPLSCSASKLLQKYVNMLADRPSRQLRGDYGHIRAAQRCSQEHVTDFWLTRQSRGK